MFREIFCRPEMYQIVSIVTWYAYVFANEEKYQV